MSDESRRRITHLELDGHDLLVVSLDYDDPAPRLGLTRAEGEVCRLLLEGRSNAEIATARGGSARTVANQVRAILEKAGVRSRRELSRAVARSSR